MTKRAVLRRIPFTTRMTERFKGLRSLAWLVQHRYAGRLSGRLQERVTSQWSPRFRLYIEGRALYEEVIREFDVRFYALPEDLAQRLGSLTS